MRIAGKIAKWLLLLVVAAMVGLGVWLWLAPPALIQVAAGYSAKMVCSNVFVAGRDADEVLQDDVQAPGHPLLKLVAVDVDREAATVEAGLFGLFGGGLAVFREGFGCAAAPDGDVAAARQGHPELVAATLAGAGPWPQSGDMPPAQTPEIDAVLDDQQMTGPGMRAVVVVQNGQIIGERYGEGFSAETPLLGWSMTKTVTAAIIGTLIRDGRLELGRQELLKDWQGGDRGPIALEHLMAMSSGLEFNEEYGDVTDVTRMLYLEPDMAGFASAKPLAGELGNAFSYSSGTTVILSRIWQNAFADPQVALRYPREALFDPLFMASAVLETDARGTFVGSSYLYATARDWARFGQFLLQDGSWQGRQILAAGYVDWMREPAPASNGEYGRGQVWLHGPTAGTPEGEDPDAGVDLPDDTYWMLGHDGQTTAIIPSKMLVVVRLGLTPSDLGYKPQRMVEAIAGGLQ